MLQVVQAFDRVPFAEVPVDDVDAMEAKLKVARRALEDRDRWMPPHERASVLRRAAGLLDGRREHFARQIAREGGKPLTDAIVEVTRAIDGLQCAADELRTFAGREVPMGLTAASAKRWAFTTREPIGVVFAISAFNPPLNLIVHQVAPAIAVGCPVIVKPASATPLSCRDFVALLREAGLPEGWCQTFIPRSSALAEQLACDPHVAFLSFIGSASVGWRLHSKLARGTRSALEHGGVAPAIVDRSADLERIIEPLVKGGFYHAGQVCVSTQRIFVHDEIVEAFTERLVARVSKLRIALGFEYEEAQAHKLKTVEYKDGKRLKETERLEIIMVKRIVPPDTTACIFWLKNRRKVEWRARQEAPQKGDDAKEVITLEVSDK